MSAPSTMVDGDDAAPHDPRRVSGMTTFLIQLLLLAVYVGAAIVVGKFSERKGYDFWLGFVLAFVVTFVVAVIIVAVLRDRATGRRGVVTWT
jgi:hypothetical protein